jgi:hypothetical protein
LPIELYHFIAWTTVVSERFAPTVIPAQKILDIRNIFFGRPLPQLNVKVKIKKNIDNVVKALIAEAVCCGFPPATD